MCLGIVIILCDSFQVLKDYTSNQTKAALEATDLMYFVYHLKYLFLSSCQWPDANSVASVKKRSVV